MMTAGLLLAIAGERSAEAQILNQPPPNLDSDSRPPTGRRIIPRPQPQPEPTQPGQYSATRMLGVYSQPVYMANGRIGLQITSVISGTAAARAGLEPGDIIVSANGYWMQSPDQLRWAVANSGGPINLTLVDVRTGRYIARNAPL